MNKPCPFCTSTDTVVSTRPSKFSKRPISWIVCVPCGARGPVALHEELPYDLWNKRLEPKDE